MNKLKKILKGRMLLIIAVLVSLVIGGAGGFFIGQHHEQATMKAQRGKMGQNFKNGNGMPAGGPGNFQGGQAPDGNSNNSSDSNTSSDSSTSSSTESSTTGV
ncbi:hypothetical protein [Lactococcus termiticola]|uniref:Uncharacterized protein n=1 Tax=Lactococcus termiticola TaxID=2169526 RepID=A0A2R5HE06_9LACT|nr:hypothetical protein [Lactococcus termiticola]GBG96303.1 hypothetical protein NtB2_00414 [Lactococcus termiticola]